jgi:muramoyltetrapeptide carboxypeptidase
LAKDAKTIGICAPASCFDRERFDWSVGFLADAGFKTVYSESVFKRRDYLAGGDEERAADLNALFADTEVDVIMCVRGGYGSSRMISSLDLDMIKGSGKAFIGASDACSILFYLQKNTALDIFFGPFVTEINEDMDKESLDLFLKALKTGTVSNKVTGLKAVEKGRAVGSVTGGCLSIIQASLKTAYEIDTTDKILFIEDTAEQLYKVDRMLIHLKNAGKFDVIKGVIAGTFTKSDFDDERLAILLHDIFSEYKVPIVTGFPAGHGEKKMMIPFNKNVILNADAGSVEYPTGE